MNNINKSAKYKYYKIVVLLTIMCLSVCLNLKGQKLVIYPSPSPSVDSSQNKDFSVKVRKIGGTWHELYGYNVMVANVHGAYNNVENASMCSFDFSGMVEIAVTYNKGKIRNARVRPLSYDIKHEIKGNTLYFKLSRPHNLSVEINGDIFHNLHLFANPIEKFVPDKSDTSLIYFGPGIHYLKDGKLYVPSNKTVFLAGGAVLFGQILFDHVHNARLLGRGVIDPSVKMGVYIAYSKNITVEGVVCTQCATGGSDSVTIKNVKAISYYGWGDGMNVFASNNVLFDGVFCRNSDDCTTVYATRKGFVGGCNNIIMQNSTLWADVAHPIQIGTHGNINDPDTLQNIEYKNIDILDHNEMQVDYQGCMSINAGDDNFIKNVKFDNIRVEDFRRGQLVNLRIFFNKKYCKAPGQGIENVLFKNVTYNGTHCELSIIAGYDSSRMIKNVTFDNLCINGLKITDDMSGKPAWYKTSDMARFFIGEHVEGIKFK